MHPDSVVQKWRVIMQAVADDPVSRTRTIFDLINEPDVVLMRWETYTNDTGYVMPGAADVYHQMLAVGHAINPGTRTSNPQQSSLDSWSCV